MWATGRPGSIEDVTGEESPHASLATRAGLHGKFAFTVTNGRKVTDVIPLQGAAPSIG